MCPPLACAPVVSLVTELSVRMETVHINWQDHHNDDGVVVVSLLPSHHSHTFVLYTYPEAIIVICMCACCFSCHRILGAGECKKLSSHRRPQSKGLPKKNEQPPRRNYSPRHLKNRRLNETFYGGSFGFSSASLIEAGF